MNKEMSQTETEADVGRAWVAARLDEQLNDPMHTTTPEKEFQNYGRNADVMMMNVDRSDTNSLIAQDVDPVYAMRP